MKYTKGPWMMEKENPPFVKYAGWWIRQNNNVRFPIAFVTETIGGKHSPQKANARLIAAAPELLEACIIAKDAIGWQDNVSTDHHPTFKILKQAIAKAEGPK